MRVWVLTPEPPYTAAVPGRPLSGVGRHLAMLLPALEAAGVRCSLLPAGRLPAGTPPEPRWRLPYGPLAAAVPSRSPPRGAAAAPGRTGEGFPAGEERPWAAQEPPDLIHVHDLALVPEALDLGHRLGSVPVVWTAHREPAPGPPPFAAWELAGALAPSAWMARRLRERPWLAPVPVHLVEAGPYPMVAPRERAGPPPGVTRVVSWGRWVAEKGWEDLLQALPLVAGRLPGPLEWVVAGAGPLAPLLARAVHRELPGVRLRLRSPVTGEELAAWLRTATAVVVPSREEVAGMVALEAMLAGVPLVASTAGGLAEVLGSGEAVRGWPFPPGDPAGLADALIHCLSDLPEASRRARRALGWVLHHRGWPRLASRLAAVYRETVRAAASSGAAGRAGEAGRILGDSRARGLTHGSSP